MGALADALDRLRSLPFPEHPASDELDDWLMELLAVDGHLAGLAATAIAGGAIDPDIDPDGLSALEPLARSLAEIQVDEEDRPVQRASGEYLAALARLGTALRASARRR